MSTVGLLHDIGKIAIEDGLLSKSGPLNESEYDEVKRHCDIGYRILGASHDMPDLAEYVLLHHERWDGKGYPKGMIGQSIPVESRIIAIADAYEAMTSSRPFRSALSEEKTLEEIRCNAGTQFDPEIARLFIEKVLCKSWV